MKMKFKNRRSVQELLGLRGFTRYGLSTAQGELLLFQVAPTNISVLSQANIAIKIRHLMMVLSALPDLEITCTDGEIKAGNIRLQTGQPAQVLRQILSEYKSPRFDYLPPY